MKTRLGREMRGTSRRRRHEEKRRNRDEMIDGRGEHEEKKGDIRDGEEDAFALHQGEAKLLGGEGSVEAERSVDGVVARGDGKVERGVGEEGGGGRWGSDRDAGHEGGRGGGGRGAEIEGDTIAWENHQGG